MSYLDPEVAKNLAQYRASLITRLLPIDHPIYQEITPGIPEMTLQARYLYRYVILSGPCGLSDAPAPTVLEQGFDFGINVQDVEKRQAVLYAQKHPSTDLSAMTVYAVSF